MDKPTQAQPKQAQNQKPAQDQNQGEGNRSADREYREAATRFADTDEAKKKAREAAEDLDEEEERGED